MVSNKSWEKFKKDVEGLTKTGVEKESWGRRSTSNDINESLSRKRCRSIFEESSLKEDRADDVPPKSTERDEIRGFSSSDDEPQDYTVRDPTRGVSPLSKKTSSRSVPAKKKRKKIFSVPELKDVSPITGFHQTSRCYNDRLDKSVDEWKNVACHRFHNSFTTATSPSIESLCDATSSKIARDQEDESSSSEGITWSDSDDEVNIVVVKPTVSVRNFTSSQLSKAPFSASENDLAQELAEEPKVDIESDIDEFHSDSDNPQETPNNSVTNKTHYSPSISPNSPTPTPTSPNVEERSELPPINSTKKKKQKYLRSGLAEKLRKLLMRQKSEKSFWMHKLRQIKDEREDSDDYVPKPAERTVTLRVLTHHLDHSVYVITCDVISQDVISERELPSQVTILLEKEVGMNLRLNSNPLYLRIYPPWKIFDLPSSARPVLLCVTHCEVVPDVSDDLLSRFNNETTPALPTENASIHVQAKASRSQVFGSSFTSSENEGECSKWTEPDRVSVNDNGEGIPNCTLPGMASRSIMDAVGVQGQAVKDRINFIARVQRVYWRYRMRRNTAASCTSSVVQSIIENSKLVQPSKSDISLCLLIQDSFGFFSEILLPSDVLLARTNWQRMLSKDKESVFTFHGLQFLEHRKRKRRLDVFRLIDFLNNTCSTIDAQTEDNNPRQTSCFTFCADHSTVLQQFMEDEDVPPYLGHRFLTVDHFHSDGTFRCERVSFYGKLLYVDFKTNQQSARNHARLFLAGFLTGGPLPGDDGISKIIAKQNIYCDRVIQVRYHGRTSDPGWDEASLALGRFMYIQDVVVDKDNPTTLTVDSFSLVKMLNSQSAVSSIQTPTQVDDLWSKMMSIAVDDVTYARLKDFSQIVLPNLNIDTQSNTLVRFEGVIFDVDQANAFCWFTCNECGSDDISELPDSSLYVCNACGLDISSPVTNTHLEVYLKSAQPPPLYVKAKLLQSTVSGLLPVSDAGTDEVSEGYDVQCILHKRLGPTSWYVLRKFDGDSEEDRRICFKLQEIDTSSW